MSQSPQESLRYLDLCAQVHGLSTCPPSFRHRRTLGFRNIFEKLPARVNAGFQSVCPPLMTSHTVEAFLAFPSLMPNRVPPPLATDSSHSLSLKQGTLMLATAGLNTPVKLTFFTCLSPFTVLCQLQTSPSNSTSLGFHDFSSSLI